jgi:hypothetical protein
MPALLPMEPRFDVFRRKPGGSLAFVDSTQSLELGRTWSRRKPRTQQNNSLFTTSSRTKSLWWGERSGVLRLPVPGENVP